MKASAGIKELLGVAVETAWHEQTGRPWEPVTRVTEIGQLDGECEYTLPKTSLHSYGDQFRKYCQGLTGEGAAERLSRDDIHMKGINRTHRPSGRNRGRTHHRIARSNIDVLQ